MNNSSPSPEQFEQWLAGMRAGDVSARDELIRHFYDRYRRLTRKMLKRFPGVKGWDETDDVCQNAFIRLLRALKAVSPQSDKHFVRLAAKQVWRELRDLARRNSGPAGEAANRASPPLGEGNSSTRSPDYDKAVTTCDPGKLAAWSEFHEKVAGLPDKEREVFEMVWYGGLTQPQAAAILGVDERTVKRRLHDARENLHGVLKGKATDG